MHSFAVHAYEAENIHGYERTLSPSAAVGEWKVEQSIADGVVYISQDGGPWAPLGGGGGGGTLDADYQNGPAGNTILMTDALGPIVFSSAITTGPILNIVTSNAPATVAGTITGLNIDMSSLGTAATPATVNLPAITIVGARSSVAKAAGAGLVNILSSYRNATALSIRIRNKQALTGSAVVVGWDATNYEGSVASSILTGQTHVVTIDGQTNVDNSGNQEFCALRLLGPNGGNANTKILSVQTLQTRGVIAALGYSGVTTLSGQSIGLYADLWSAVTGNNAQQIGAFIAMGAGIASSSSALIADWRSDGGTTSGVIKIQAGVAITLSGSYTGIYADMTANVSAGSQVVNGYVALLPASTSTSTTGFFVQTIATAGRFLAGEFTASTTPSGTIVGCEIDCQTNLVGNGQAVIGARYRITSSSNASTAGVIVDSTSTGSGSAGVRVTLTPTTGSASGVIVSMGANVSKTGLTDGSAFLATLVGANACGLCVAATYSGGALAQNGIQMRRETTSSASFTESTTFLECVNTSTFNGGTQTFSQSQALVGNYATVSGATHTWSGNLLLLTNAMTRSSGTGTLSGTHLKVSHVPTGTFTDTTTGIAVNMTPATSSAVTGVVVTMAANTSSSGSALNAVWNSAAGTDGVTNNAVANIYTNASMNSAALTFLSIGSRTANLTFTTGPVYGILVDMNTNTTPGAIATSALKVVTAATTKSATTGEGGVVIESKATTQTPLEIYVKNASALNGIVNVSWSNVGGGVTQANVIHGYVFSSHSNLTANNRIRAFQGSIAAGGSNASTVLYADWRGTAGSGTGGVLTVLLGASTTLTGTLAGLNVDLTTNLVGGGQLVRGLNVIVGNSTATVAASSSTCATFDYRNPAGTASGNGIVNVEVGAATTLTGRLVGLECDVSTNVTAGAQAVTGLNVTMPATTGAFAGVKITTTGNSSDSSSSAGLYIVSGAQRNGACGFRLDAQPTASASTFGPQAMLVQTTNNNWVDNDFIVFKNTSTGVNAAWNMLKLSVAPTGMSANAQMRTFWSEYAPTFTSGTYSIGTLNHAFVSGPTWNSAGTGTLGNTLAAFSFAPVRSAGTLNITGSIVMTIDHAPTGTIGTDDTICLRVTSTPNSAATGAGLVVNMANANAGGAAISIAHSGTNANQLVFTSAADGTGAHVYGPTSADLFIRTGINTGTSNGRSGKCQASDGSTTGSGGSWTLQAGAAAGSNQNGGDINLTPTAQTGAGTRGLVNFNASASAIAGAVPATLGNTGGGTGPATAAQNQWLAIKIGGTINYIPCWQ